jgi:O-antigen/teichoic acid export membrane protein
LWGISLSIVAVNRIDNFLILKYIDYTAVAEYSIILIFVRIYDFAAQAIWSVYSQKFATDYDPNMKRFLLKIIFIAGSISIFYFILGKPLLHFLFKGKYDNAIYLLLPFCIIGCLRLIYMFPSCYLVGKSQTSTLKIFLLLNILGVILMITFLVLGIIYFGLLGAVLSGVFIWCYRNITGFFLVFKDMKKIHIAIGP